MNAPEHTKELGMLHRLTTKARKWEDEDRERDQREIRIAWRVAGGLGFVVVALGISLATLAPLRRNIPYLIHTDAAGNVEVLQTFDNRLIGRTQLKDMSLAWRYVQARERYNWWLIGADNDYVMRTTDQSIVADYAKLFQGLHAIDKEFGDQVVREVRLVSLTPSPVVKDMMVVRWERQTRSKGMIVEPWTPFISNVSFKYIEKTTGPVVDQIQNPDGYDVYNYQRDVEFVRASAPVAASSPANAGMVDGAASGVAQ